MKTAPMSMIQALRSAMDVMLERDPNVVIFGQDVGYFGGVFRCTEGLQKKYGKSRVFDAPISEGGIVGAAVGMGAYGLRPVPEIQFADYFYPASDQIVSEAARLRYRSAGEFTAPITIRMPCGGGIYGGQTHSQSPEALFTQVCGLRTVMPSNPYDAKGLLIAAIENDDPVIFLEPKRLYNGPFDGHHENPVVPWSQHAAGRGARGLLHGAAGVGLGVSRRQPAHRAGLRHHGVRGRGRGARDRHRRRDHRPAQPVAAGPGHHRRLGEEDPALRGGARGHAHLRLRGGVDGAGAGALLLPPGGADRARDRLGHAVSARPGVAVFPRPRPRRRGLLARDGGMMGTYIIKTPDIGEGIAEVELVAWHVREGDTVVADQLLADVMTDKATVEIPSPVAGRVLSLGGSIGQAVAVGSELIRLEVAGEGNLKAGAAPAAEPLAPQPNRPNRPNCQPPRFFRPSRCHRRSMPASACGRLLRQRQRLRLTAQPAARPNARLPRPPCAAAPGNWAFRWSRCVPPARPGASCRRTWTLMPARTPVWRRPPRHPGRPMRRPWRCRCGSTPSAS